MESSGSSKTPGDAASDPMTHHLAVMIAPEAFIPNTTSLEDTADETTAGSSTPFSASFTPSEAGAGHRHRLSTEAVHDRPAVIIITHSDLNIIKILERPFHRYGLRIETKRVTTSCSPMTGSFVTDSIREIQNFASEKGVQAAQIGAIEFEINSRKSGQTPPIEEMVAAFTQHFPRVYVVTFSGVAEHSDLIAKAKQTLIAKGIALDKVNYFSFFSKAELEVRLLADIAKAMSEAPDWRLRQAESQTLPQASSMPLAAASATSQSVTAHTTTYSSHEAGPPLK
jgi:hypothetical protein